jgi:phage FluMu protein Com
MENRDYTPQIRCGNCDKLLGRGTALNLAIKCPRCRSINQIKMSVPDAGKESLKSHKGADNE